MDGKSAVCVDDGSETEIRSRIKTAAAAAGGGGQHNFHFNEQGSKDLTWKH